MGIIVPATKSISVNGNDILDFFNEKIIAAVKEKQPPKMQLWNALQGIETHRSDVPMRIARDDRMWTRGDGSRYKELNTFKIIDFKKFSKKIKYTKRVFKSEEDIQAFCWNEIITAKNAKRLGTLSGTFGSSDYHEIYRVGKMVFINRPWGLIMLAPAYFAIRGYGDSTRANNETIEHARNYLQPY